MHLNRRRFLALTSLALVPGLSHVASAHTLDDGFRALRGGVGTFTGRGGTIGWYVADDALVIVDSQFPESAQQLVDGIKQRSQRRIDFLINSHHHGDHVSGNGVLKPMAEHIVGHKNVPDLMAKNTNLASLPRPDVTFEKDWKQAVGKETLCLHYYGPAHTSGDSVIRFEEAGVVHMGDLVFNRIPPYIDRSAGASIQNWITVLEKVHEHHGSDVDFIFGHAHSPEATVGKRDDLLTFRDFLTGLLEYTRAGINAGKSVDDLARIDRLPKFENWYSEGRPDGVSIDIRIAYEELTAK